jgi:YD repeat-containing protein
MSSFAVVRWIPLALALVLAPPNAAADIVYVYDELDRLVGVIDPAGDAVTYTYDAVGNLLSIGRQSSARVSIIDFTPKTGPIGTAVTISGTGFAEAPTDNAVTFDGRSTAVVSSTTTELVAIVPPGATTGPIGIAASAGSATSRTPFAVTPDAGVPTITGFTPTIGPAGTTVTISGTNFDVLANDRVTFNSTIARAPLASATPTQIMTTVPGRVGSGRLVVATPAGQAVSAADFFVPPPPYTPGDIAVAGRMAVGDDRTITIPTANKIGLVVFDGVAGQRVSLGFTTPGPATVSLLNPDGATGASSSNGDDIDTVLGVTGTYTISLDPLGSNTGSFALTLTQPALGSLVIDGPPVAVNLRSGQDGRLTFTGTAGQRVSLAASDIVGLSPDCTTTHANDVTLSILKPDGTVLATRGVGLCGEDLDVELPVTGTYTVTLDVKLWRSGSLALTLSQPVTVGLSADGPTVPVTIRRGQDARMIFEGVVGQWISVAVTDLVGLSTACNPANLNDVILTIFNPEGTVLATKGITACGDSLDVQLTAAGQHAATIDVIYGRAGSLALTLSTAIGGVLTSADPPQSITLRRGQDVRKTFEGTAGQWVSLSVSDIEGLSLDCTGFSINDVRLSVVTPGGSTLATQNLTRCGGDLDVQLPVTGTYLVVVDGIYGRAGRLTLALSTAATGVLTAADPPTVLALRKGQDVRMTFTGTAGQWVDLAVSDIEGLSLDCSGFSVNDVTLTIVRPDGGTLATQSMTKCGGDIDVQLPATGTYTAIVDAAGGRAGTLTLTLSHAITGELRANDPPTALTLRNGQDVRLTFAGTAGQWVDVAVWDIAGLSLDCGGFSATDLTLTILKPDGTLLASQSMSKCGGDLDVQLPVSGTFTALVDAVGGRAGSLKLALSAAIAGELRPNDPPTPLTLRNGQDVRMTFAGTTGQWVDVAVTDIVGLSPDCSGFSAADVTLRILKPDGGTLATQSMSQCGGDIDVQLPTGGTYSVVVDAVGGRSGSLTVTFSQAFQGTLVPNAPPTSIALRNGQDVRMSLAATAGQPLTVAITNIAGLSLDCSGFSAADVKLTILRPDGTTQLTRGTSKCGLTLPTVPTVTGIHTIVIDATAGRGGSLTLAVTSP